MAAFDFPNSPSNGDTYSANGMTFTWNGTMWKRTSPSVGAQGSQGATGSATISNNAQYRLITGGSGTNLAGNTYATWNGNNLALRGGQNQNCTIELASDEGDNNNDFWRVMSQHADSALAIDHYGTGSWVEKLRITSAGNVDINGTPPWSVSGGNYRNLSISGNDASSSGFLWLGNGAAATNADFDVGRLNFCNGSTIVSRVLSSTDSSANDDGRLSFYTKATGQSEAERLRIASDGTISKYYNSTSTPQFYLGGTSQVNGIAAIGAASAAPLVIGRDSGNARSIHCSGNIQMASGYGIDFSANTDAGGTSSGTLLEDYEEGSYTITSNTNLTMDNARTGYYTKIGNLVNVIGYLSLNTNDGSPSVSGTDNIVLSLPYARDTSTAAYTGTMLQQNIDSDTPTSLVGHPRWYKDLPVDYVCMAASDGLRFYINRIEAAYVRMNNSHLHVGYPGYTYIVWNITYRTT